MTEKRKTLWNAGLPLLALLIIAATTPLAAAEPAAPAFQPAAVVAPMTPMAPTLASLAADGAMPIFLAQCLPPCLTCQPGFFCGRNANGCLVCMRCLNPDPRFCPSGG